MGRHSESAIYEPTNTSATSSYEKGLGQIPPHSPQQEPTQSKHLRLGFVASRTVRQLISDILSRPICGTVLQKLQERKTAPDRYTPQF